MSLGELEPVKTEEPLIISASLEGLKKVVARLAEVREANPDETIVAAGFQKYVDHSDLLKAVAEEIDNLIKHLEIEKNRTLLLILGDQAVAGRELMQLGKGKEAGVEDGEKEAEEEKALGGLMTWPAYSRQLITYSKIHSVENSPDMMPDSDPKKARYYSGAQLVIGNDSGVIPFFRLNDIHEQGGWVEVVPKGPQR